MTTNHNQNATVQQLYNAKVRILLLQFRGVFGMKLTRG